MSQNTIALEELRDVVEAISRNVEELRETGISERALLMLIRSASPSYGAGKQVTQSQVQAVLDGMEALAEFVFPQGDPDE